MRRAKVFVFAALTTLVLAARGEGPATEDEIRALLAKTFRVWSSRDERAIRALYANDPEIVFTFPDGRKVEGADAYVKESVGATRGWKRFRVTLVGQPWISPGSTTASAEGLFRMAGQTKEGQAVLTEGTLSIVWVRSEGRWLITHQRQTVRPPPTPTPMTAAGATPEARTITPSATGADRPARAPQHADTLPISRSVLALLALNLVLAACMVWLHRTEGSILAYAASRGWTSVVRGLLKLGWPSNARDSRGRTALARAAGAGSVESCAALLKAGAPVTLLDGSGASALHHAVRSGSVMTVSLLLRSWRGAMEVRDTEGLTPPDLARVLGHDEVLACLEQSASVAERADPSLEEGESNAWAAWPEWARIAEPCPRCKRPRRLVLSRSQTRLEQLLRDLLRQEYARCLACGWRGRRQIDDEPSMVPRSPGLGWFLVAMASLAWVSALLVSRLMPPFMVDESYFKGTAYRLAAYGEWANPYVKGMYPGVETAFVPYPPLFIVAQAGWYKLMGFGATETHQLAFLLQWTSALLAGLIVKRLAVGRSWLWCALAAVGTFACARLDRPDPLATMLALATVLLCLRLRDRSSSSRRQLPSGRLAAATFVGMLLVVPAATVIYGALLALFIHRLGLGGRVLRRGLIWAAVVLPLVAIGLSSFGQEGSRTFLSQCFAAIRPTIALPDWISSWRRMGVTPLLGWFAALAVVAGLLLVRRVREALPVELRALVAATGLGLAAWLFLTPRNETYLALLAPFASISVLAACANAGRLAAPAALVCTLVGALPIVSWTTRTLAMTMEDSYYSAEEAIRRVIPSGVVVAGDPCLWTILAQGYTYIELNPAWGQMETTDWVVASANGTGRPGVSTFEAREQDPDGRFELVYDGLRGERQQLFGVPLGRSRLGYGIRIFHRRQSNPKP